MTARFHSLTVDLAEEDAEHLEDALHDLGAAGLEVRDREAPPMPGVRGPQPGEVIVVGWFEDEPSALRALALARDGFPSARFEVAPAPDEDWSTAWRARIRAVEVGRFWVGPPWDRAKAPAGKVAIVIEPKMAFGTGDHPTTALCLEAVDAFCADHPGASVLDVGTGSGVLAIAAHKLGAAPVVGIDNDQVSVELARENLEVNDARAVALSGRALDEVPGPFDLVLANILANTLVDLAPALTARTGVQLSLSGVLHHQADQVAQAITAAGLVAAGVAHAGEWVRLDFRKR